jgi:hypothetical protein
LEPADEERRMPEPLYALVLLACPLGMGAMMWMMMRGQHASAPAEPAVSRTEVAELRAQLEHLQAQQPETGHSVVLPGGGRGDGR